MRIMDNHNFQTVNTNQLVITQANTLVYAAYEMTLQEKRLLLLLISMVRQEHTRFHTYCIPVRQIAEFLEIDKKRAYKVVDETCNKLMSRVLHIQKPSGDWDKFHWVSTARYRSKNSPENQSGESELQLKAHDEMHPLLLELKKQFASIPLEHIANLSSYHSIRLFEILFHKSHRLQKPNLQIDLDDLKKSLGVEGKYSNFADFKRRVLEPAKKNLEKKTPIKFTYLTVKKGRKVAALDFMVTENPPKGSDQIQLALDMPRTLRFLQLDAPEREIPTQHQELLKELAEMGYVGNGLELIGEIGEQAVRGVLEHAKEQEEIGRKTGNEIKNMGGLIRHFIEKEVWKNVTSQEKTKEGVKPSNVDSEASELTLLVQRGIAARSGEVAAQSWFRPSMMQAEIQGETLVLHIATNFMRSWIKQNHKDDLEEIKSTLNLKKLELVVDANVLKQQEVQVA